MPSLKTFFRSLATGEVWRRRWRTVWLFVRRRYPILYMVGGFGVYLAAWIYLTHWLPGIANDLAEVLSRALRLFFDAEDALRPDLADEQVARLAEIIRNLGYALAAVLGALAILATIPFQIVKIWVNERAAHTAEQNLITQRLTDAVQMLGAEKTVKRIEEIRTYRRRPDAPEDDPDPWLYEDGERVPLPRPEDGEPTVTLREVERTEPNLEVRLGALYALERISNDSDADHLTVLDIVCAYIRENAEAKAKLAPPRADIAAALAILGRRTRDRRALEKDADRRPDLRGVDFRRNELVLVDLKNADLSGAKMDGANLRGAKMEGAVLSWAKMEGAVLSWAKMEGAVLFRAKMEGADLSGAEMEGADLSGAKMEWANLSWAKMEGANLIEVSLTSTDLTLANLGAAAVKSVEVSEPSQIRREQIDNMFGDASVRLLRDGAPIDPASEDWPHDWPRVKLDDAQFYGAWRWWREARGLPWPPPGKALAALAYTRAFPPSDWPKPSDPPA